MNMYSIDNFNLKGKKGLIIGIANTESIAYGCAKAFKALGADLAITHLNKKSISYVAPIAEELGADILMPCNVQNSGELEAVFDTIKQQWGQLDFVLHSIAFAPNIDLHGQLIDSSSDGFLMAMDVSCHSFIRMSRLAAPLMTKGGSLFAMSFYGAEKVVENYDLMGPVKSALESSVRYLASELGHKGIRVYCISPGPVKTRASSGLKSFDKLISDTIIRTPTQHLATIADIGKATALMATPAATMITGETIFIDGGHHIMG
jgi:enoyl-[acyl-carrier protein] reductase I